MKTFRVYSSNDGKRIAEGVQFGNSSVAIGWLEGEPEMFDSLEKGLPKDAIVEWDENKIPVPTHPSDTVFCPHCCTTSRVHAP
jgi:hypothetical protein